MPADGPGRRRLAGVVQRSDARRDRRRGDRQQSRPAPGRGARWRSRSRPWSWSGRSCCRRSARRSARRTTRDEDHERQPTATLAYAGVAWELDVWGKLRAQRAAAEAGYEATALDYAYARQSLAATTAKTWYLAIETRQLRGARRAGGGRSTASCSRWSRTRRVRRQGLRSRRGRYARQARDRPRARSKRRAKRMARRGARLEVLLGRYPAAEIEVAAAYPALPAPAGAGVPVRAARTPARPRRGRARGAGGVPQAKRRRSSRCCPISRSR